MHGVDINHKNLPKSKENSFLLSIPKYYIHRVRLLFSILVNVHPLIIEQQDLVQVSNHQILYPPTLKILLSSKSRIRF